MQLAIRDDQQSLVAQLTGNRAEDHPAQILRRRRKLRSGPVGAPKGFQIGFVVARQSSGHQFHDLLRGLIDGCSSRQFIKMRRIPGDRPQHAAFFTEHIFQQKRLAIERVRDFFSLKAPGRCLRLRLFGGIDRPGESRRLIA